MIKKHTSLYIDVIRFISAFLVFIFHMSYFSKFTIPYIGNTGTEPVLAFFVLSGFVISHSTTKHLDIIDFFLSRLSRLWSVALPALLIIPIVDIIGQHINVSAYTPLQSLPFYKWPLLLFANAIFINQIWTLDLWPGTDGPFWSLSYEFWYYCLFGLSFYLRGYSRAISVFAAILIAGPKILLAFPVWLIGAFLYWLLTVKKNTTPRLGLLLWLMSFTLAWAYTHWRIKDTLISLFPQSNAYSEQAWEVDFWPNSCIVGLLIALNIYGYNEFGQKLQGLFTPNYQIVRQIADSSFGLYLFHYPLGYLFKSIALSSLGGNKTLSVLFIYSLTFVSSMSLALLCERHKATVNKAVRMTYKIVLDHLRRHNWLPDAP